MTVSPATAIGAPNDAASLALLMMLTLFVLLVDKVVAANVSVPGSRRLSQCLEVGVVPLGIGTLVVAAAQLAQILGLGS